MNKTVNRIIQIALVLLLIWQGYNACNRTSAKEVVVTDTFVEVPFYGCPYDTTSVGQLTQPAVQGTTPAAAKTSKGESSYAKTTICIWSYQTFEYKEDSTFMQVGDFPQFYLRNRDHYTSPVRSKVKSSGAQPPKEADLLKTTRPYLRKAQVRAIFDLRKDTCWVEKLTPIENDTI
jgi:hypothetical protein